MYSVNNSVYNNYMDCFVNNLHSVLKKNINFKLNNYKFTILKNVKFYLDLITFKSNDCCDNTHNQYLNFNYNLYYSINIPVKVNFNNLSPFYLNYNIINIPKINQSGDILLNGYFRIPILYLQLSTKCVVFKFNNYEIVKYLFKLKPNLDLYIYTYDNNVRVYLNSYKLNYSLVATYYNFIFKNKYIDFNNIINIIYILNIKNNKKFNFLNKSIRINKFFNSLFYIEIFNIIGKLINLKFNKNFLPKNDNLTNKFTNSILTSIFKSINKFITISTVIKHFYNLKYNLEDKESLSINLFKENLLLNPTIHYTNQLNILSYLINKFKINIFGYSNISNDKFTVDTNLRKIQNDYIGFINLINTPDGETCGLLSILANNTIFDKYKLKLINTNCNILENFEYIDIASKNINNIIINNFSNIKKNKAFKIKKVEILKNNEFKTINNKKKNNKNINISNILSITELIIPFLFNDDPCRGLMGSRMHLQALPLIYNNAPYVITKYNNINNLLSFRYIYSLYDGIVIEVDNNKIIILDEKNRFIYYYLYPFNVLDYNSLIHYKPIVWEGEKVCVGKILAVPTDLKNSEFTLGFNNYVNYSFYGGYEHEDAIVIDKDLLIEDTLTSIAFDIYEDYLSINKFDYIEFTLPKFLEYNKYPINRSGIFKYNNYMFSDELLISKIKYELSSSKNKKLFKIFKLIFKENKKLITTKKHLKIKKGGEGRLVKYEILSHNKFRQLDYIYPEVNVTYLTLRFFIFRIDRVRIGDKMCGRHGNKGVISKIVETIDLPYTSNESHPYSITSPIGALARINLGQFFEGICGYLGFNYNCRVKSPINLYDSYIYSNLYTRILNSFFNKYKHTYIPTINKEHLRDFKTGYKLKNFNLLSMPYYFKLMHTSKSKFQYRTIGSYSNVTQQPVKGKNINGSQKFGEMEVWALESHGSSYNINELTSLKTNFKLRDKTNTGYRCSESFKVLTIELKNILININVRNNYRFSNNYSKTYY